MDTQTTSVNYPSDMSISSDEGAFEKQKEDNVELILPFVQEHKFKHHLMFYFRFGPQMREQESQKQKANHLRMTLHNKMM